MSDAPERIFAWPWNGGTRRGQWSASDWIGEAHGATEYVRVDLFDRQAAAIKRQAGAAKTLREHTLAEVQHLKDMDRSEYNAAKTLDSEREANSILTAEVEAQAARIAELEEMALQYLLDAGQWCDLTAERDALRAENERLRAGADAIGFWMSAALEDPNVSDKMKSDINTFFDALDPPQPAALDTKGGA